MVNRAGDFACFTGFIPGWHNDQQIHVAVSMWLSIGVRSEQDNLVGLEFIGDLSGQSLNGGEGDAPGLSTPRGR
jgi:hypothetical protein